MARTSAAVPIFVAIALFLSVVVAFAAVLSVVSAEDADQPPTDVQPPETATEDESTKDAGTIELPDDATLLKMKVRELKAILTKKGPDAECLACTSKREYVDRIRETADWPTVEEKSEDTATEDAPSMDELRKMFAKGRDSEQMEQLKKNLEAAGIDISNIFTADQFDSEKFAEQFKKMDAKPPSDAEANKEEPKVDL